MKDAAFLDTSAWFAALSARQEYHGECEATYRRWLEQGTSMVTTTLVVAEMHVLLLRRTGPAFARKFLAALDDGRHEIASVDVDLVRQAETQWIRGYEDQGFSLCDAVSFQVMHARRIKTAFAFDHHFQIAGFRMVP